ncbi:DUF1269 domain-containing protein [Flammeovirga sp. EKP202]|uniref:DUF1269 domain-containing protein n=1 Tax=Flammeovirga sp. EKP202 TaxID=2770592 RepID=UPI00165F5793|nr:DUF1269 domain-containing protein [Flammeovirga sp. EKP202]MBD0401792.1 DUF1269 domain-containing protein [Flammeovirga sp. EKP202]
MNKLIVSVFDNQSKAFEGLSAIKELNTNGDISLYASTVISKNDEGEITVNESSDQGPIGAGVGMLTGAFIGLFGGPIGMVAGAMAGSLGGLIYDFDKAGVDTIFIEKVSEALESGKTAIIADIEEGWNAPLDTKMKELGGILFRRNRAEVAEEQFNREADAIQAELDDLEHELEVASEESKESIHQQIKNVKKKAVLLEDIINQKIIDLKIETEAKASELQKQLGKANENKKKKINKRKDDLELKFNKSLNKLSEASEKLTKYIS